MRLVWSWFMAPPMFAGNKQKKVTIQYHKKPSHVHILLASTYRDCGHIKKKKKSTWYLSTMHRNKQMHWVRITFSVPSVNKPVSFLIHHGSMCAIINILTLHLYPSLQINSDCWYWYGTQIVWDLVGQHAYAGHAHTTCDKSANNREPVDSLVIAACQ